MTICFAIAVEDNSHRMAYSSSLEVRIVLDVAGQHVTTAFDTDPKKEGGQPDAKPATVLTNQRKSAEDVARVTR